MSRVEENEKMISALEDRFGKEPKVRYEEAMNLNLGSIFWCLTDISKSLAVIADAMKEKDE